MSVRSHVGHQRYFPSATENGLCLREDRKCNRCRVESQRYCLKHIKAERDGVYRRCNYISSRTGRRCPNILLRTDSGKEGFCFEHARLVTQVRRQASHRNRFRDTVDSLAQSLGHYAQYTSGDSTVPTDDLPVNLKGNKPQRPLIDYYSESSDDDETREGIRDGPIVTEDAEAELDDADEPLRHAGIFTTEEIATLARDKLIKLQSLYCEYFKILAQKLKYRRRRYKEQAQIEAQKFGHAVSGCGSVYKDEKKSKELRALRRYRRHLGVSGILRTEAQELRKKQAGLDVQEVRQKTCIHHDGNSKACTNVVLPESSYCSKHILLDGKQLLFFPCNRDGCSLPVFPAGPSHFCWLHKTVPLTKDVVDVESDSDDCASVRQVEEEKSRNFGPPDARPPLLTVELPMTAAREMQNTSEHTYL